MILNSQPSTNHHDCALLYHRKNLHPYHNKYSKSNTNPHSYRVNDDTSIKDNNSNYFCISIPRISSNLQKNFIELNKSAFRLTKAKLPHVNSSKTIFNCQSKGKNSARIERPYKIPEKDLTKRIRNTSQDYDNEFSAYNDYHIPHIYQVPKRKFSVEDRKDINEEAQQYLKKILIENNSQFSSFPYRQKKIKIKQNDLRFINKKDIENHLQNERCTSNNLLTSKDKDVDDERKGIILNEQGKSKMTEEDIEEKLREKNMAKIKKTLLENKITNFMPLDAMKELALLPDQIKLKKEIEQRYKDRNFVFDIKDKKNNINKGSAEKRLNYKPFMNLLKCKKYDIQPRINETINSHFAEIEVINKQNEYVRQQMNKMFIMKE